MNLSKIHHIAIIVSDYEASKDFYVNKLGFSVIRENYRPERKDWKLDLRSVLIAWSRRSENWRKLALNVSQFVWMITPARR